VTIVNALQLEAARATPALSRHYATFEVLPY